MNFYPISQVKSWLHAAASRGRARASRRHPDAIEPQHRGWTGHSLAIEAALTTGLDGSTGALVSLWKATDAGSGRGTGRANTFIPEWQKSYSGK